MLDEAVLSCFESLGDNCEFGIVQRACGVKTFGLLTFARTPPDILADMLGSNLEGVDDSECLRIATRDVEDGLEYILFNDRLGIVYHIAEHHGSQPDPADLLRSEAARLRALAQALREKLAAGAHIFVVKCNEDLTFDEARQILDQIDRHGRGALLYVVTADSENPAGSVVEVAPRLYRGHVEAFAPYHDAYGASATAWIALCRGTLGLHRARLMVLDAA